MSHLCKISVLSCLSLLATGCETSEKSQPVREQVKIGDLAPRSSEPAASTGLLKTINFDIHIYEIPADKISELDAIWAALQTEPLRFTSYPAFADNFFRAGFGQIAVLSKIHYHLLQAGGQKVTTISLLLQDGQTDDLPITTLNSDRTISFVSSKAAREKVNIGPGILALRLKAQKIPPTKGVCKLIGYPVFAVPMAGSIPQLMEIAKAREFIFDGAAFGAKISPGELVFLAPAGYSDNLSTLCGLFFCKPEGSLFFSATQRKPPERKPAVRLLVLVCTEIRD